MVTYSKRLTIFALLCVPFCTAAPGDEKEPAEQKRSMSRQGSSFGTRFMSTLWGLPDVPQTPPVTPPRENGTTAVVSRDPYAAGPSEPLRRPSSEQHVGVAVPPKGELELLLATEEFKQFSDEQKKKLVSLLTQVYQHGARTQSLITLNQNGNGELTGAMQQAYLVLRERVAEQAGQLQGLMAQTTTVNDHTDRIRNLENGVRVLEEKNPFYIFFRFIGQWMDVEKVGGLAEKVFGFIPFTAQYLPHTIAILGGMEVANRLPVPFRSTMRPFRFIMWLTFVVTSLRSTKQGVDTTQDWVLRVVAPVLEGYGIGRGDTSRITKSIAALVVIASLYELQRRGRYHFSFRKFGPRKL